MYYFAQFYDIKPATTKMVVLSISHKIWKKNRIYWRFYQAFVKKFMKKLLFLMQISKVHVRIYFIVNFHDLKLSATKMAPGSM